MTLVEREAIEAAENLIRSGAFDADFESIIIETLRKRDDGLNRVGFILKMAVEMMDRSTPRLSFRDAKIMARRAYDQFRKDNGGVLFGDPEFSWTGADARLLAREYEISYWEQVQ